MKKRNAAAQPRVSPLALQFRSQATGVIDVALGELGQLLSRVEQARIDQANAESELRNQLAAIDLEQALHNRADTAAFEKPVSSPDRSLLRLRLERTRETLFELTRLSNTIRVNNIMLAEMDAKLAGSSTRASAESLEVSMLMMEAREQERARLAREIHDGPAQVMVNAVHAIRVAEEITRRDPAATSTYLPQTRQLLSDGVAEMRRFMFDLHPVALQDLGLASTLKRYTADLQSLFSVPFNLDIAEPLPTLTRPQELALFRIAQEAIQNALKHAGEVTAVDLLILVEDDQLELSVRDRGSGFEPAEVRSGLTSGTGLRLMAERAQLLGAELSVDSRPGKGTEIRLTLPLQSMREVAGAGRRTV